MVLEDCFDVTEYMLLKKMEAKVLIQIVTWRRHNMIK